VNSSPDVPAVNVLGTRISALNPKGAIDLVEHWINRGACGSYVCVTGVHGVMEAFRNAKIRKIFDQADACVPDGMPMVWLGRLQGFRAMDRVYGPDLMLALLRRSAERGYTNYFYGGGPTVAEELKDRMQRRFPGLRVVGTFCPPFRPLTPEEEARVVADINEKRPDLLWIGLSTPKQEIQMAAFSSKVLAHVMLGVGAAFDFHTGRVRQAPRWVQRCGLEWLFRLCIEPRRLWRRYLRNNPLFLWHVFLQWTRLRKYPAAADQ
jgi:N-acetylglucosaminyldiphosphoundecaprenol N-acetyl-beta-D-mannosaminyltransferase